VLFLDRRFEFASLLNSSGFGSDLPNIALATALAVGVSGVAPHTIATTSRESCTMAWPQSITTEPHAAVKKRERSTSLIVLGFLFSDCALRW
jgi:hypothetical protein